MVVPFLCLQFWGENEQVIEKRIEKTLGARIDSKNGACVGWALGDKQRDQHSIEYKHSVAQPVATRASVAGPLVRQLD